MPKNSKNPEKPENPESSERNLFQMDFEHFHCHSLKSLLREGGFSKIKAICTINPSKNPNFLFQVFGQKGKVRTPCLCDTMPGRSFIT